MTDQTIQTLENEAGFKALFQFATISIFVTNKSGEIELVNPSAEKLFGYSKDELIGQSIELLMPNKFRASHLGHIDEYFENPRGREMGSVYDLFAKKKDESEFPVEISLGYYQIEGKNLAVAFVTDISRRKKLEGELLELNADLEEKVKHRTRELADTLQREKELNKSKSAFVSMASHEFRTPLSAILSSVFLIDRYFESGDKEKGVKHVGCIKEMVRTLTDILNDFLSLDKLERGKVEDEKESFNLENCLTELIEGYSELRNVTQIVNYTHTGEQDVVLDKKILRNIITNLVSNAIKYSEKDIELSSSCEKGQVCISVEDKGIGIPEEEQADLFNKFFRAKNAANIQGTGLGLNIVERYIELLEGTIEFESKLGKGTIFRIKFPQKIQ